MDEPGNYTLRAQDGCKVCPHGTSSESGKSTCATCRQGTFATRGNPFEVLYGVADSDRSALAAGCADCGGETGGWDPAAGTPTSFAAAMAALNRFDEAFVCVAVAQSFCWAQLGLRLPPESSSLGCFFHPAGVYSLQCSAAGKH
jgi:hypothetical protein